MCTNVYYCFLSRFLSNEAFKSENSILTSQEISVQNGHAPLGAQNKDANCSNETKLAILYLLRTMRLGGAGRRRAAARRVGLTDAVQEQVNRFVGSLVGLRLGKMVGKNAARARELEPDMSVLVLTLSVGKFLLSLFKSHLGGDEVVTASDQILHLPSQDRKSLVDTIAQNLISLRLHPSLLISLINTSNFLHNKNTSVLSGHFDTMAVKSSLNILCSSHNREAFLNHEKSTIHHVRSSVAEGASIIREERMKIISNLLLDLRIAGDAREINVTDQVIEELITTRDPRRLHGHVDEGNSAIVSHSIIGLDTNAKSVEELVQSNGSVDIATFSVEDHIDVGGVGVEQDSLKLTLIKHRSKLTAVVVSTTIDATDLLERVHANSSQTFITMGRVRMQTLNVTADNLLAREHGKTRINFKIDVLLKIFLHTLSGNVTVVVLDAPHRHSLNIVQNSDDRDETRLSITIAEDNTRRVLNDFETHHASVVHELLHTSQDELSIEPGARVVLQEDATGLLTITGRTLGMGVNRDGVGSLTKEEEVNREAESVVHGCRDDVHERHEIIKSSEISLSANDSLLTEDTIETNAILALNITSVEEILNEERDRATSDDHISNTALVLRLSRSDLLGVRHQLEEVEDGVDRNALLSGLLLEFAEATQVLLRDPSEIRDQGIVPMSTSSIFNQLHETHKKLALANVFQLFLCYTTPRCIESHRITNK